MEIQIGMYWDKEYHPFGCYTIKITYVSEKKDFLFVLYEVSPFLLWSNPTYTYMGFLGFVSDYSKRSQHQFAHDVAHHRSFHFDH